MVVEVPAVHGGGLMTMIAFTDWQRAAVETFMLSTRSAKERCRAQALLLLDEGLHQSEVTPCGFDAAKELLHRRSDHQHPAPDYPTINSCRTRPGTSRLESGPGTQRVPPGIFGRVWPWIDVTSSISPAFLATAMSRVGEASVDRRFLIRCFWAYVDSGV
jgi:hypothetical protein